MGDVRSDRTSSSLRGTLKSLEVLITSAGAWILSDESEAPRLHAEELPPKCSPAEEAQPYGARGCDAAEAMTDVRTAANPEWTGFDLAGAVAEALCVGGIEPTLTLVGGERRPADLPASGAVRSYSTGRTPRR